MKKACLLILLFISGIASAQTGSSLPKNQFKLSPLRLADFGNPGIEVSYERLHQLHYSTRLSAAYLTDLIGVTPYENEHGIRIALEEKYFFGTTKKNRSYLAAEASYYYLHFDREWYGEKRAPDSSFINFTYFLPYRRTATSISVKYGWQYYISRHILVDASIGIGFRSFTVTSLSKDSANAFQGYQPVGKNALDDLYDKLSSPGSHSGFIIPFNIQLGYTF